MNLLPADSVSDFSRVFDDFFPPSGIGSKHGKTFFTPRLGIEAEDDHYLIKADIPGVKKDNIHVTLEDGILTLDAERIEQRAEPKKGKLIRKERRSGKFARSLTMGRSITVEDISGNVEDAVLAITVPKTPVNKRVEISRVEYTGDSSSPASAESSALII